MSNTNDITSEIKEGQLQLYDFYQPSLEAGNYHIVIGQTLGLPGVDTPFKAQQKFVVSAPQFALSSTQIINQYPPAGSTGKYAEVLPHIVLKDPMLAWERDMHEQKRGDANPIPWLALLVFDETELVAGDLPATQVSTTSVDEFRALDKDPKLLTASPERKLLVPKPKKEDDVDGKSACQYIRISTNTFEQVVPHLDELCYLSHVRKVNTGDRPALGLHEHGLFSVTMANRFPKAPAAGDVPAATKNIVHLVSLEGLGEHLTDAGVVGSYTEVVLLSLASWTFFAQGDSKQDFAGLGKELTKDSAESRLLRLPGLGRVSPGDASVEENVRLEVRDRLRLGYVPLAYHTRSGEDTFAWYRGPLAPQLAGADADATPRGPFRSPDAALVYDPAFDVFDVSLAAAWELGREAALADVAFGPKLLHLRRKAAGLLDALHHQQSSTATQLQQTTAGQPPATIHEVMKDQLGTTLLADIGTIGTGVGTSPAQAAAIASEMANTTSAPAGGVAAMQAELKKLLLEEDNPLLSQLTADLQPLTDWLGRLLLLWQVPFDNLVPDERLLPAESLRFFHLDADWFRAALDGAISLGLDSSKQVHFNNLLRDTLLAGTKRAAGSTKQEGISGFLLRSDLVAGWPNLAVYAKVEVCHEGDIIAGPACTLLRIDHLAPDVLLCLFDGVPKQVVLSEPAESLRFGVDEAWNVALRHTTDNSGDIGEKISDLWPDETPKITVEQRKLLYLRSLDSRVLDLGKLLKLLNKKFPTPLGPAAFSLQLIKAPESIELPAYPKPEQPAA